MCICKKVISLRELGMLGSGIMHFKAGESAGEESRQTDESGGAEEALNTTWHSVHADADKHTHTHTHTYRHTRRHWGLIGSADKSQADGITQEERLSFGSLHCRPPGSSRCLCACGDSNLTAITKPLTSNNNPEALKAELCEKTLLLFLKWLHDKKVLFRSSSVSSTVFEILY